MSYDIKFKQRALSHWDNGHGQRETAKLFAISRTTLINWRQRLSSGEGLAPKTRKRNAKKIPPERLREIIAKTPDAYCGEIAAQFACPYSAVWYALGRLGLTLKKKRRATRSGTRDCGKPSAKPSPSSARTCSAMPTRRG